MPRHSDNTWLERISGYLQNQTGVKNGSAAGNPAVQNTGGIYYLSPQTFVDGAQVIAHYDANGNLLVNLATTIAGEDLTNDVIKTEDRSNYTNISASALIKTGAGRLKGIMINSAAATATIKLWDNTSAATTVLLNTITLTANPNTMYTFPDVEFTTGLYCTIAVAACDITLFWK